MAFGDIYAKCGDDGEIMFRMEGAPVIKHEDVETGRATGLFDMDGKPLFDGDEVLNLNVPPSGKAGQVRLAHLGKYTFWTAAGASIQKLSDSPEVGVRKL
jgi:hypothetical protein